MIDYPRTLIRRLTGAEIDRRLEALEDDVRRLRERVGGLRYDVQTTSLDGVRAALEEDALRRREDGEGEDASLDGEERVQRFRERVIADMRASEAAAYVNGALDAVETENFVRSRVGAWERKALQELHSAIEAMSCPNRYIQDARDELETLNTARPSGARALTTTELEGDE